MDKEKCSVSWCPKAARSGGYCRQHYRRFKRQGSPVSITGDVASLLSLLKAATDTLGEQAQKIHRANRHTSVFTACSNGLCGDYHRLKDMAKGVSNGTKATHQAA